MGASWSCQAAQEAFGRKVREEADAKWHLTYIDNLYFGCEDAQQADKVRNAIALVAKRYNAAYTSDTWTEGPVLGISVRGRIFWLFWPKKPTGSKCYFAYICVQIIRDFP